MDSATGVRLLFTLIFFIHTNSSRDLQDLKCSKQGPFIKRRNTRGKDELLALMLHKWEGCLTIRQLPSETELPNSRIALSTWFTRVARMEGGRPERIAPWLGLVKTRARVAPLDANGAPEQEQIAGRMKRIDQFEEAIKPANTEAKTKLNGVKIHGVNSNMQQKTEGDEEQSGAEHGKGSVAAHVAKVDKDVQRAIDAWKDIFTTDPSVQDWLIMG